MLLVLRECVFELGPLLCCVVARAPSRAFNQRLRAAKDHLEGIDAVHFDIIADFFCFHLELELSALLLHAEPWLPATGAGGD